MINVCLELKSYQNVVSISSLLEMMFVNVFKGHACTHTGCRPLVASEKGFGFCRKQVWLKNRRKSVNVLVMYIKFMTYGKGNIFFKLLTSETFTYY